MRGVFDLKHTEDDENVANKTVITPAFPNSLVRAGVVLIVFRIDVGSRSDEKFTNLEVTLTRRRMQRSL